MLVNFLGGNFQDQIVFGQFHSVIFTQITTTVPLEVAHATQVVFNSILNMKNKSYTSTHLMKRNSMQLNASHTSHAKYAIQTTSPSSI